MPTHHCSDHASDALPPICALYVGCVLALTRRARAALRRLLDGGKQRIRCQPLNVGTGTGSTVLEMIAAMEKACGHKIPHSFVPRRAGDTEAVWAATEHAEQEMGWKSKFTVEDMCRDQWRWAEMFPKGYE